MYAVITFLKKPNLAAVGTDYTYGKQYVHIKRGPAEIQSREHRNPTDNSRRAASLVLHETFTLLRFLFRSRSTGEPLKSYLNNFTIFKTRKSENT
jgi:hypothetical protein